MLRKFEKKKRFKQWQRQNWYLSEHPAYFSWIDKIWFASKFNQNQSIKLQSIHLPNRLAVRKYALIKGSQGVVVHSHRVQHRNDLIKFLNRKWKKVDANTDELRFLHEWTFFSCCFHSSYLDAEGMNKTFLRFKTVLETTFRSNSSKDSLFFCDFSCNLQ